MFAVPFSVPKELEALYSAHRIRKTDKPRMSSTMEAIGPLSNTPGAAIDPPTQAGPFESGSDCLSNEVQDPQPRGSTFSSICGVYRILRVHTTRGPNYSFWEFPKVGVLGDLKDQNMV